MGNTPERPHRLVGVNERGLLIGEDHPKAVLSDAEVLLLLELRGEGYGYGWLAQKFEVSRSCVQKICTGKTRATVPVSYRRIRAPGGGG